MIDVPWQNILSPETGIQNEVPLFLEIPNFLTTQCRRGGRRLHAKKAQSIHSFNTISDCDRQAVTYRQTATANTMLALR